MCLKKGINIRFKYFGKNPHKRLLRKKTTNIFVLAELYISGEEYGFK